MKRQNTPMHPSLETLTLFARKDLTWWATQRVAHHVRRCVRCEHEVERVQTVVASLKHEAEGQTLTSFEAIADWRRLEREMLGNIKVGVSAARCIEKIGRSTVSNWKGAVAFGVLSIVFTAGWFFNLPKEDSERIFGALRTAFVGAPQIAGTVIQTTPAGIAVRSQGATLTLLHPASALVTLSVDGTSSVGARYVDDETGQVTITNVYGQ